MKLQDAHTRRVATKTVPSSSGAPMPVFQTSKVLLSQNSDLQSSAFDEAQFYLQITHLLCKSSAHFCVKRQEFDSWGERRQMVLFCSGC